jgi:hypothetical protein
MIWISEHFPAKGFFTLNIFQQKQIGINGLAGGCAGGLLACLLGSELIKF